MTLRVAHMEGTRSLPLQAVSSLLSIPPHPTSPTTTPRQLPPGSWRKAPMSTFCTLAAIDACDPLRCRLELRAQREVQYMSTLHSEVRQPHRRCRGAPRQALPPPSAVAASSGWLALTRAGCRSRLAFLVACTCCGRLSNEHSRTSRPTVGLSSRLASRPARLNLLKVSSRTLPANAFLPRHASLSATVALTCRLEPSARLWPAVRARAHEATQSTSCPLADAACCTFGRPRRRGFGCWRDRGGGAHAQLSEAEIGSAG